MAEAIPVELSKTDQGWQLLRGGEPYFIKGAGGTHSLEVLAATGANSIRTWDAENVRGDDDVDVILDEAHALGMTVAVGIWLGHERHGFDYNDPKQVAEQKERVRGFVERYKDHPAVLLWGLGNEMEGFDEGDNPAVWEAVNDIAAMVKEIDPNHPTMTTTAFVHGKRIEWVHHKTPAIDIHGINAYGGAVVVPQWLADAGATKPFVFTEFGPVGSWEMPKTEWGAPIEQTSSEKADFYRRAYQEGILDAPGVALGGYAFLWGHKMEGTATWFGMVLPDGTQTNAVDTMTELWSGDLPNNLAPKTSPIRIDGPAEVDPEGVITVSTKVSDPEGSKLDVRWVLRPESGEYLTGGDYRPDLPDIVGAVLDGDATGARVKMPEYPGGYRLFLYAYDGDGKAGTANVPLLVKGEVKPRMPFPVYNDGFENNPWVPSGWMGNTGYLSVDGAYSQDVHSGSGSIRMRYEGVYNWVGVVWQHPSNNWGDMDGGISVEGASELEFWARGEYGGEKVGFGVGLVEQDRQFPDSSITKVEGVALTSEWKRYTVPLKGKNLSSLKSGFWLTITGRSSPVTIYLDSIRFIK